MHRTFALEHKVKLLESEVADYEKRISELEESITLISDLLFYVQYNPDMPAGVSRHARGQLELLYEREKAKRGG